MNKTFLISLSFLALTACAPQNDISTIQSPDTAIVGGDKVEANTAIGRSTVGIYEAKLGYICSGTLVAKNLVLTAAHCVDPKTKDLVVFFAQEMKKASKDQLRRVTGAIVHPDYTEEMKEADMADLALIRFEGEAAPGYVPAPILFDGGHLYNGTKTIVAGYGLSWTIALKRGAGTLRTTELKIDKAQYSRTEAMLGQSVRKGICSGDSGGPAYLEINGRLHVWGVASRGDSLPGFLTPKCMLFSVFTRVDAYQTWIIDSMAELSR